MLLQDNSEEGKIQREMEPRLVNRRLGRVLYTGPRQYWERAAPAMIRHRLDPIHLTSLVIQPLTDEGDVALLEASVRGDVPPRVVFPSKNAIYGCIDGAFGGDEEAFRGWTGDLKLHAMGADADYLEIVGARGTVIKASRPNTSAIVDDLKKIGARSRVLVYVPRVVAPLIEPPVVPDFLEGLSRIGCQPMAVVAYETCVGWDCAIELDMMFSGGIDAIAISSQAEVQAMLVVAGGADGEDVGRERVLECIHRHDIVVAAHGETTATGIRSRTGLPGVEVVVSKDSSTFDGLAEAISTVLSYT